MTRINVYDVDAETIEKFAEEHDFTTAEVIEALLDFLDELI